MNAARRPPRSTADRPAKASTAPPGRPRQSVRQVASTWLAGIRFSGFSLIMLGVLVMAVVVLAPSIAEYAEQRQQIAELKAEVARQEAAVAELIEERERWNDETFIVTQARERLYYVRPGEVSYLVIDDRAPTGPSSADRAVSADVTESHGDWMETMLRSMMTAGLAPAAGSEGTADQGDSTTDEGTR